MNFKKLALLSLFALSTTVPTLPMNRLARLARPALGRLNIFKTAGLSATRQALSTQARTARLLAGAGAATATAALLSQQPAESAAQIVTYNVYTTPKGLKKRIIIIHNNDCDRSPKIRAQIPDIVNKHNAEVQLLIAGLQNTTSPAYLLIDASEDYAKKVLDSSQKGQKPETLLETAIVGAQTSESKPQTSFVDKRDNQDLDLLCILSCPDEELLARHKITVEHRDAILSNEFSKYAERNNARVEEIIRAANLPKKSPFQVYVADCIRDIYSDNASLYEAASAVAQAATVTHALCEVFEKIIRAENNTIVVVANKFVAQQLQDALEHVANSTLGAEKPFKTLGCFAGSNTADQNSFVKEDFGKQGAIWIQNHENLYDGKRQK